MKKILLAIIVVLILLLLIHVSFLAKTTSPLITNKIEDFSLMNGFYSYNIEDDEIVYGDVSNESDLNIYFANILDNIIYKGSIDITQQDGITNVDLGKGIYLVNISELNSKFSINGEGFKIENDSPAVFFVDTRSDKTLIFSENSIVNLKLLNNSEVVNEIFLYPHLYIKFNSDRVNNVKDADMLRVNQWFPIEYFGEEIFNEQGINSNFYNVIGQDNDKNIEKMFLFLKQNYSNENEYLQSLSKIESLGTLSGEKFIQQYGKIFLNDVKKIVYYKNTILRGLGKLLNSPSVLDNEIDFILETMEEIRKISQKDYDEMKEVIFFYSSLVIGSCDNNGNTKINFSKLYNKLEGNTFSFANDFILTLNNIYLKFDKNNVSDKYNQLYKEIGTIIPTLVSSVNNDKQKGYLTLFLNKVITSGFDLNININNILPIFSKYTDVSLEYYTSNDKTKIRTGIAEYSIVLEELLNNIRNYFFMTERNKDGFLILNEKNPIVATQTNILKGNLDRIFSYYDKNKGQLEIKIEGGVTTGRDLMYVSSFEKSKTLAKEYISALEDYSSYSLTEEDKKLLGSDNNAVGYELKVENAMDFLKTFNYLDLSSTKIYLRDYNYCELQGEDIDVPKDSTPYCYKVNNVKLYGGKTLNFKLTPSDYNKISNIVIDGNSMVNRGTYRLDKEKITLDEAYRNSGSMLDRDIFLFENFFYFTFGQSTNTQTPDDSNNQGSTTQIPIEIQNETATIRAFKSILLGRGGELYDLNGFINITYNNVIVKEVGGQYDIEIRKAPFHYLSDIGDFEGEFSSKYLPSPDISFQNPSLILYNHGSNEQFLLHGSTIILNGKYSVKEFKNTMNSLFTNYQYLNNIINNINYSLGYTGMDIIYDDVKNSAIKIKNDSIEINIKGYIINSIKYRGKEVLTKNISTYDLSKTLDSLN